MGIPSETIEQVAAANDIVEVIGSYFPLKRAGANFKALCPFHQEKTPSFMVSAQRQAFHCFGCGVGGSVFRFVMEYEHVDFPAAVRKLAARAGVAVAEERADESRQHEKRRTLLKLHADATQWFQDNLLQREIGARARAYLKTRSISRDTAKAWQLGYAPDNWNAFAEWASERGYKGEQLRLSGLVALRDGTDQDFYDRFRNRLMFPICNDVGEVIAFSGRTLAKIATTAKYINSPDTPLFRKGQVLFGLDKTKRALIGANSAVVCEGQLDLITLFEAGVQNVVAPQGTAFTEHQARVLRRFVSEVVLCFDADAAGQNAVERSLEPLLQHDFSIRVAEIPAGEDPDSVVRNSGRPAFEQLIESAPEFFDYWLEKKASAANLNSLADKMRIARELAATIQHLREPLMRAEVISKVAARLAVRRGDLEHLVGDGDPGRQRPGLAVALTGPAAPPHEISMLCLLALRDEDARAFLTSQNWRDVLGAISGADLLTKILASDLRAGDSASLNAFQSTLSPQEESIISGWLLQKLPANPANVAREWWNGLRKRTLQHELEVVESRLRLPNLTNGEVMQLQKQVLDLRGQLRELQRFSSARAHQP